MRRTESHSFPDTQSRVPPQKNRQDGYSVTESIQPTCLHFRGMTCRGQFVRQGHGRENSGESGGAAGPSAREAPVGRKNPKKPEVSWHTTFMERIKV